MPPLTLILPPALAICNTNLIFLLLSFYNMEYK